MSSLQLDALVLRSYPSGENDCIYRLLTPTLGKISAIAKSVKKSKKRFSSFPEPFDTGQAEIRRGKGDLFFFNGFVPKRTLLCLRESLDLFTTACVLSEAFDGLIHEGATDHAEELFHAAVEGLAAIGDGDAAGDLYRPAAHTLRKLLRLTGFLEVRGEDLALEPLEEWQWAIAKIESVMERPLKTRLAG